jgi:hypothetical protein
MKKEKKSGLHLRFISTSRDQSFINKLYMLCQVCKSKKK